MSQLPIVEYMMHELEEVEISKILIKHCYKEVDPKTGQNRFYLFDLIDMSRVLQEYIEKKYGTRN